MSAKSVSVKATAEQRKHIASLSVDLDNLWAYLKAMGDPTWQTYPSYFDLVTPQMLTLLRERGLQITFFIVARDAQFARNLDALAAIAASGHEIGNHSLRHDIWLSRYAEQELDAELAEAERRHLWSGQSQSRDFLRARSRPRWTIPVHRCGERERPFRSFRS